MNLTARVQDRVFDELALGRPGPVRSVGRLLYRGAAGGELATRRALAAVRGRKRARPGTVREVTAVIKTFERPQLLRRLLASIQRLHPEMPVVVVDDSREPIQLEGIQLEGIQLVTLPYDSGVSAGRAAGLEQVRTKYVLMLDDDLVLYRRSDLIPTLALMDRYPDIDLTGGRVLNLPLGLSVDYRRAPLFPTKAEPKIPLGTLIGGLPVYDKVANFYVGRADRIRQVGWEPTLKRLDHRDFFSRARGVLTTVFDTDLRCLHVKGHFDDGYLAHRYDMTADQAFLADRWPDLATGMT